MTLKFVKAVLVLLLCTTIVHAQKISSLKIPPKVKASFSQTHPEINKVVWELEDGSYEAGFSKNGIKISELYRETGVLMETETEITIASLSARILAYINGHYKGLNIREASKIINHQGVITYEAAIKGRDLIFDESGSFIKEVND